MTPSFAAQIITRPSARFTATSLPISCCANAGAEETKRQIQSSQTNTEVPEAIDRGPVFGRLCISVLANNFNIPPNSSYHKWLARRYRQTRQDHHFAPRVLTRSSNV